MLWLCGVIAVAGLVMWVVGDIRWEREYKLLVCYELCQSVDMVSEDLRTKMASLGCCCGMARFYRIMAKLEDEGKVIGWYEPETVAGHELKRRMYRVNPGITAYDEWVISRNWKPKKEMALCQNKRMLCRT